MEIEGQPGGILTGFAAPTYEVDQMSQALGPGGETKKMTGRPKIGEAAATFSIAMMRLPTRHYAAYELFICHKARL